MRLILVIDALRLYRAEPEQRSRQPKVIDPRLVWRLWPEIWALRSWAHAQRTGPQIYSRRRCGQVLQKTRRSTSGHGCSLSMTQNGFFVVVLSKWPRKTFINASRDQRCGNTSTWLHRKRPSARNVALVWHTRHRPQRCFITCERCMGSTYLVRRLLQAKKLALMLLWCRLRVLLIALQQKVRK